MWIQNILDIQVVGVPLLAILLCGLAGILIDVDHPIAYLSKRANHRFLHAPIGIACGIVLLGIVAFVGRLFYLLVLGS